MTSKLACLFAGLSLAASGAALSRPVDLSAPSEELGAANPRGYAEVWREVNGVGLQLGKGSYLPLRYRFSTESNKEGLLGAGFYLPLFEARNVLIREDTMKASLPCGKALYLWRDHDDPNKFQTPDKEWTGYLRGDDFTVSREDGWKVSYQNGRLSSVVSDGDGKFNWVYDATGGGSVEHDGKSIIATEPGAAGRIVGFTFDGKSYKVEFGKRPIEEMVARQPVLKELVPALTKLGLPDGTAQVFEFGLTDQRLPKLKTRNVDGTEAEYTWEVATGHLAEEKSIEGEWTYEVGEKTTPFGLPPIVRKDSDGRTEKLSVDLQSGTYNATQADGSTLVTHVIKTPGPLYGKVTKVEKVLDQITSLVYRASYDQTGRLLRSVDAQGFVTTPVYDERGNVKSKTVVLSESSANYEKLHQQEQVLAAAVAKATEVEAKQRAIVSLVQLYLFEMRDYKKAGSYISQLDHEHAYAVRAQSIISNDSFTAVEKINAYQAMLLDYPDHSEALNFLMHAIQSSNVPEPVVPVSSPHDN